LLVEQEQVVRCAVGVLVESDDDVRHQATVARPSAQQAGLVEEEGAGEGVLNQDVELDTRDGLVPGTQSIGRDKRLDSESALGRCLKPNKLLCLKWNKGTPYALAEFDTRVVAGTAGVVAGGEPEREEEARGKSLLFIVCTIAARLLQGTRSAPSSPKGAGDARHPRGGQTASRSSCCFFKMWRRSM
jgi:hypothetical protein